MSLERFQGCMLGLAIGDALGPPTEFIMTLDDLHAKFGQNGVTDLEPDRHPAGTYTDDTQMSLAVASALIEAGHKPLDVLMPVMARRFVVWSRSPDNDRAPGTTCMRACRNLAEGVSWEQAGVENSKGCGTAIRTAPIGLFDHQDETKLIEVARASALPTHGHPTALAAAAATALLVAWTLHDDDPTRYPARLATIMRTMDGEEVADLVDRIPELLDAEPDTVLRKDVLGEAWVGESAVASALYCFCRNPRDYRRTVLTGAKTIGDSDSIACIAGAISGAYNGLEAIPKEWRDGVENSQKLHEVAADLLAGGL